MQGSGESSKAEVAPEGARNAILAGHTVRLVVGSDPRDPTCLHYLDRCHEFGGKPMIYAESIGGWSEGVKEAICAPHDAFYIEFVSDPKPLSLTITDEAPSQREANAAVPREFWRDIPCGHPQDPVAAQVEQGWACHCGWLLDTESTREVEGAPGPVVICDKCCCHVAIPDLRHPRSNQPGRAGGGTDRTPPARPAADRVEALEAATTRLAQGLAALATIAPGGTRWPHHTLPSEHRVYALVKFEGANVAAGADSPEAARAGLVSSLIYEVTGEDVSPCPSCGDPVGGDAGLCGPCLADSFEALP